MVINAEKWLLLCIVVQLHMSLSTLTECSISSNMDKWWPTFNNSSSKTMHQIYLKFSLNVPGMVICSKQFFSIIQAVSVVSHPSCFNKLHCVSRSAGALGSRLTGQVVEDIQSLWFLTISFTNFCKELSLVTN